MADVFCGADFHNRDQSQASYIWGWTPRFVVTTVVAVFIWLLALGSHPDARAQNGLSLTTPIPIPHRPPVEMPDDDVLFERLAPHYETWGGVDVRANSWSAYSGTTMAITGDLDRDGARLRFGSGYGRFDYSYDLTGSTDIDQRRGEVIFTDALLGWQKKLHSTTLKAFAGAAVLVRQPRKLRTSDSAEHQKNLKETHTAYGPQVRLETWTDLSPNWVVKADGSVKLYQTDAFRFTTASTDLLLGYRARKDVLVALEGTWSQTFSDTKTAWWGDVRQRNATLGLMANWNVFGGVAVSAGAGASFDLTDKIKLGDKRTRAYGRFQFVIAY